MAYAMKWQKLNDNVEACQIDQVGTKPNSNSWYVQNANFLFLDH